MDISALLAQVSEIFGMTQIFIFKTISKTIGQIRRFPTWVIGLGLGFSLLLGGRLQAQPPGVPATVERVQSGQTLELLYPLPINNSLVVDKIRLRGITAPDLKQEPWGPEARNCLRDQVQRQVVRIEPASSNADTYGRLWADVWWGARLVNETLLEAGCVFLDEAALTHHPHRDKLIYAQERARILGLGVWNPAQPLRQSPDDFRRSTAVAPASES